MDKRSEVKKEIKCYFWDKVEIFSGVIMTKAYWYCLLLISRKKFLY